MNALVDPATLIARVVESVFRPRARPDYNAWAEQNVVFGRESPVPGPYRKSTFPPAERILECLSPDHPCRVVTVMGSAQIVKTTVAQIFVGGTMDLDPCDILYTHPTHDNAMRWARGKWRQMRLQSKALKRIFGETKSRDSHDTTLFQERKDGLGSLMISGANSPASLSMISVLKQVQDDLAKWEPNTAGDPEKQADSRSAAFDWAKILKLGTPLFAKTCRITRAYKAGTQERWHVPCPQCNHFQPLEWPNFLANIDREAPEKTHFTCVSCGFPIEHRHKRSIVARGHWVAENPRAHDVSFHTWRAYAPTRDWASIATEWIAAEGEPSAEQTFYNDVLGLPYEVTGEAPAWEGIRDRSDKGDFVYDRGIVPLGGLLLNIGVDCQADRTECHVKAFGMGRRRWTVDYLVIPHHIGTVECRAALDAMLKRTWPDTFNNRRRVDMLAIDANAWTQDVFDWARQHSWNLVICTRGAKSELAPPLALTKTERRPDGVTRKAQKRFYNIGVSQMKSWLYEFLGRIDPQARGYCGYPRGLEDDFYRQLTAERRVVSVDRNGYPSAKWTKDYPRNEVLDTELIAEAAAIRCGFYSRTEADWLALSGLLELKREQEPDLFDPARSVVSDQAHVGRPIEPSNTRQPKAGESLKGTERDFLGGRADDFWQGHFDGDD